MSTDELWFGDWGCGHYSRETSTLAAVRGEHPGECWLETGCPQIPDAHPVGPCPDAPVVRIADLVDQPGRFRDRTQIVVRGTLAIGKGGSVLLGREDRCGVHALANVQLEDKVEGACYAARLSGAGLGRSTDGSMACCGSLPMGQDVAFVARYYNYSGDGPFHVELGYAELCTMPGEVVARPKR